jgi:hypothetical protein
MDVVTTDVYENIKNVLFSDSAVAGEAAGLAMGLVMLGTASRKAFDVMVQYAHDTQHEKIIRGLAMGLALLVYGREEEAEFFIDTLMADKVPLFDSKINFKGSHLALWRRVFYCVGVCGYGKQQGHQAIVARCC